MFHRVIWGVWPLGLRLGAGALIAGFTNLTLAQVGDKVALGNWAIDRT
jgi:hypothetical protein